MTEQRIGIIDIGSNSIRLAIYERTVHGAYRVIDGGKQAGRLSEQIDGSGNLREEAIRDLIQILNHFLLICAHQRTERIRAVATAAIRNAANRSHILERLMAETGLAIELLSGEREAEFGFLGMINSMQIDSGFLIDIGGGSTELSLFRNRKLIRSVSLPFGCVNMTKRFTSKGILDDGALQQLESAVKAAIAGEPWIREAAGLPLVGVGGTVRALGKIHQSLKKYPFPQSHNYRIEPADTDELLHSLRGMPLDSRRQIPGLSKDRADLIVPGLAILQTLFKACKADYYLVCGAGLRDGLFFDSVFPQDGRLGDVLDYSIANLVALHPEAPKAHVEQVNRLALQLYDALDKSTSFPEQARKWMDTASSLFRIGASIDYFEYAKHTFYLITNAHLYGLAHREIILSAGVASYKNKNGARRLQHLYKPILMDDDVEWIAKLGMLLQLAVALDRSEAQALKEMAVERTGSKLYLTPLRTSGSLAVEHKEIEELAGDFKKAWGLLPVLLKTT
jgi:exopolyphosphatase/guanosine-5'-triphosphate,3'-diphosphate pyrophosphatase